MSLIVKRHIHQDGRLFLTVVDQPLIGKHFSQGDIQLDLTAPYYKGEPLETDLILPLLKKAYCVSFAGTEAVALGIEVGLIREENVLKVDNVPSAQFLSIG